jgi:hypothetical protein
MTDERLRDLYLAGLDARRAREPRPVCDVEPETLLALARGELPPEDRPELLDRVLASAACREELALLRAVVVAERGEVAVGADDREPGDERAGADPVVVPLHGVHAPRPPRARPWARFGLPLAAAAALALAVGVPTLLRDDPAEPVMRGEGAPVVLVAPPPEASPAEARTFTWHAVPGARRYVFELLDADGAPLHEHIGTDTTLALPAAVTLAPGAEYRWLVRAADDLGDPVATSVGRIRVR